MVELCQQAGAKVEGIGIVIEKSFQDGRQLLEDMGLNVVSLARIASLSEGTVTFLGGGCIILETKQLNTPQQTETPNGKAAVLGLQHLLAMYAGAVAVPLLIGTGLNFDSQQMTYLISIDIFMCGVATLLQLTVNKFLGLACQSF